MKGSQSLLFRYIISAFDHSGTWVTPYRSSGYQTLQLDIKRGEDIRSIQRHQLPERAHGILLAPPCTDFSLSGAQYWKSKDSSGSTLDSLALVDAGLRLVALLDPHWWVLENPTGRLQNYLGKPRMWFDPWEFAGWADDPDSERYTKRTGLWGRFNPDLPRKPLPPIRSCKQGSWIQRLGGASERTKELRSITPTGFARAFFHANP